MFQVYNEQIHDLLVSGRGCLPIREDPQRGVVIAGLTLHKVGARGRSFSGQGSSMMSECHKLTACESLTSEICVVYMFMG